MKQTFPAKNGWQDALQKLREENGTLRADLAAARQEIERLKTAHEEAFSFIDRADQALRMGTTVREREAHALIMKALEISDKITTKIIAEKVYGKQADAVIEWGEGKKCHQSA